MTGTSYRFLKKGSWYEVRLLRRGDDHRRNAGLWLGYVQNHGNRLWRALDRQGMDLGPPPPAGYSATREDAARRLEDK